MFCVDEKVCTDAHWCGVTFFFFFNNEIRANQVSKTLFVVIVIFSNQIVLENFLFCTLYVGHKCFSVCEFTFLIRIFITYKY